MALRSLSFLLGQRAHLARALKALQEASPAQPSQSSPSPTLKENDNSQAPERCLKGLKSIPDWEDSAGLSHQFHTPLQILLGYIELFREGKAGPLTPKMEVCLDILEKTVKRYEALIRKIRWDKRQARASLYTWRPK